VNGGEALARVLRACGVADLYGVPAGKLGPFARAVAADGGFRAIGTRHEAAAAWMATATFHATGRVAVCFGETGPGAHNLASGLGTARANGLAVLALSSGNPTYVAYPFEGMFMDVDGDRLFGAVTKWNAAARDPARIPSLVRRALREALAGRPGPVHLELPADVLAAEVELPAEEFDAPLALPGPAPAAATDVERAARLLADARRPLLIAGGGVVLAGAAPEFRRLARRLGAAATATQMGLGAVPTDSHGFFGHGGLVGCEGVVRALREADVVLAAGCRFSSWLWTGTRPDVTGAVVQIDVDPAAIGRTLPVEVGLLGDSKVVLVQLLDALGDGGPPADEAWLASLVSAYEAHRERLLAGAGEGEPMHPAALADELGRALPPGALAVYDGGHTTFWSNDLTPATEPRTRFHDPGMAHLGFGLPYALALKAHFPDRTVVNITGDGGFGFTLAELDTARRYRLPVVTVIHDNASWGVIRFGQARAGFELETGLEGTRYAEIARAFGCHGEEIARPDEVAPALRRALDSGLPAVIDARVRFEPHPSLPLFAAVGRR